MKKLLFSLSCLAAFASSVCLTSCQDDEMVNAGTEEFQTVMATATGSFGPESRTSFPVTNNSVKFNWSEGDQIVVLSEDGERNIGVMTLTSGADSNYGDFRGNLRTKPTDQKVHVYYLGQNVKSGLSGVAYDMSFNIADQLTAHENLTDYGFMHADAELERSTDGQVNIKFQVKSLMTYAHFYFHLPEGVNATDENVSVAGAKVSNSFTLNFSDASFTNVAEGAIAIHPEWDGTTGSAFMVFLPANGIAPEFNVTVGEKTYRATLPATEYEPNDFICGGNPAHGKDVYFSENGEWTVTYMDGEKVVDTQKENSFAPSMTFTAIAGPEKDAFNFLGWAEAENGAVVYTAGQEFTLNRPDTEKTLYAVWEAAKAENMTVIAWNNDGTTTKQTAVEYNHTWPYTFDLSNFDTPTRENYKFMGWGASADATTAITSVTFEYPEIVKEVYAIWDEQWKHTTYTLNYGEKGVYGKAQQFYPASGQTPWIFYCEEADYEYTAPAGYELIGWADEANATVAKYTPGNEISTGGKDIQEKTVYPVLKKKTSEGTITAPGSTGTGY